MVNMEFPFKLKSKMQWSKNVLEERESPDQIIIGSIDANYCVLLGLALHLECTEILKKENNIPLLFGIMKRRIRILFEEITLQEIFQSTNPNRIGTHSIRKLPATYARRNGCSKEMPGEGGSLGDCGYLYRLHNSIP